MEKETPYEYCDKKLGIKIKFLISDRHSHPDSLCLISYNALHKRIKSKNCPEKELRRASLGYDALVSFQSLSQNWKDSITIKYGHPVEELKKDFFSKHYFTDGVARDYFLGYRYEDGKKLEPKFVDLYTYNASVLNTIVTVRTNRKEYIRAHNVTSIDIWDSLNRDVNAFREVPHNLPVNRDSLRRKVTQYQKEGYACLISGKHIVKNAVKVRTKEQTALLEKLIRQHQNLNNEQISALYNIVADAMTSQGWKTIDAGTVANYRKKMGLYTYAGQFGEVAFMHNKLMQVKRTAPTLPMIYWTLDGNVTELLYQKKGVDKKGHALTTYHNRLTTVMILDPYNNYIVGYAIGANETPQLIKEALKDAINHTAALFGARYRPAQLQSDRYQIKNMRSFYEAMTKIYIPAKAYNSKAKVIEPFFDKFNEKHFQAKLVSNWSGHNVKANKENQPNDIYLNKIRHQYPDEAGCKLQIITAIENDRAEKVSQYKSSWELLPEKDRLPLTTIDYLQQFGEHTGYTNRLQGQGITPTILGTLQHYDSFDLTFRKHAHLDWLIKFDPADLTQVLAVNAKSKNGRLKEELGTYQFLLTSKHLQPMALYDRKEGDAAQLQSVFEYNKQLKSNVTDHLIESDNTLIAFYEKNPELELLNKLLITDSNGQHKLQKQNAQKTVASKKSKMLVEEHEEYEIINNPRHHY